MINKANFCLFFIICLFFIFLNLNNLYCKNLIENSSFELGASHGWGLATSEKITGPINHFDFTTSYHGNVSLKLEFSEWRNAQRVTSKIYRLKPNTLYTISFYAKSNFSSPEIIFQLQNTFESPYGPGDIIGPFTFTVTSNWERYSFSGKTVNNSEKCSYQLKFWPKHQSIPDQFIWVDAIQLEEGILTEYSPRNYVELGLSPDNLHKGNIYFEDEEVKFNLKMYNYDLFSKEIVVNYEVYDYFNKKVKEGTININILPDSYLERNLNLTLSQDKRGAFRIISWIEGMDGTLNEINYSVLPRLKSWGTNENSIIGAHVPFIDYFLSSMQKVGVKWNRTLSTGKQFRWNLIEPTKGNFIWKDEELDRASRYGMIVLGTIGCELAHVPDWAKDEQGFPKLEEWDRFVFTVVNHYKDKVKYWEIWNEPDTEGGLGSYPDFYAQLLKTACNAIRRADPDAKVIGMVAYYASYVDQVFNSIGTGYCDIVSTHRYPDIDFTHLLDYWGVISRNGNKPVWNSESGMKTDSFYQTIFWEDLWISYAQPDDWGRDYRLRTDKLIYNFAQSVGTGMKKYFYYDARNTTSPDFLITYSLFEWDGTLRPKAVAYSVLANLFDEARGLGMIDIHKDVESYLFQRGTTPLLIMWAKNPNEKKRVSFYLYQEQIKVYNVMGNQLSTIGGVDLSRSPIYIEGQGITKEQLIESLVILNSTDTEAPRLSIVTFPTGPITGGKVHFRWFAFDDVNISTRWESNGESILYSYKLEGYDSEWSNWVTTTSKTYFNLPKGLYTFRVKAKDQIGNISEIISKQLRIVDDIVAPSPPKNLKILN